MRAVVFVPRVGSTSTIHGAKSDKRTWCGVWCGRTTVVKEVDGPVKCPRCLDAMDAQRMHQEMKDAQARVKAACAPKERRISDIPGLYRVTRTVKGPPNKPPKWEWTSPPLAGTKAGLERFFAYPGATTIATLVGAL